MTKRKMIVYHNYNTTEVNRKHHWKIYRIAVNIPVYCDGLTGSHLSKLSFPYRENIAKFYNDSTFYFLFIEYF
jgi:hypothetical protein